MDKAKFKTTRTLPRAGLLAKPSNWWRRALVRVVTKNLMVTLVELHDHLNLQKYKHHINTPTIWALCWCGQIQSSPQWRYMKTNLKFAKQQGSLVWWTSILSIMFEGKLSSSLAKCIPKVKCAGSSLMLWGVFQQQGPRDPSE